MTRRKITQQCARLYSSSSPSRSGDAPWPLLRRRKPAPNSFTELDTSNQLKDSTPRKAEAKLTPRDISAADIRHAFSTLGDLKRFTPDAFAPPPTKSTPNSFPHLKSKHQNLRLAAKKQARQDAPRRVEVDWSSLEKGAKTWDPRTAKPKPIPRKRKADKPKPESIILPEAELELDKKAALAALMKKNMIIISGLSTNLVASDFYRLVPDQSLAAWESSIKKVQQQRDPKTFEPNGTWQISFTNTDAAASYYSNIGRIHSLARHKFTSRTGLWQSTVPATLAAPNEDLSADAESFTIAPPSQRDLSISRSRTFLKNGGWERPLSHVIKSSGVGWRPPVVMLHIFPPGLTVSELQHYLDRDEAELETSWMVTNLASLRRKHNEPVDPENPMLDMKEKMDSRFLLSLSTDWDARRFHRAWNRRTLSRHLEHGEITRHVVQASIIQW